MNCKTLFISGTDTGVGKTCIATSLVHYYVDQGLKVGVFKPVASGAADSGSGLQNDDALALISASNLDLDYSIVNPYVFKEPIAPHIAAEKESTIIDVARLQNCYRKIAEQSDIVVVEGAGGWHVPLGPELSFADWVSTMNWPVLLVVGIRLGCINHACLSVNDMKAKGANIWGWVANICEPDVRVPEDIISYLSHYLVEPPIVTVDYQQGIFSLSLERLPVL